MNLDRLRRIADEEARRRSDEAARTKQQQEEKEKRHESELLNAQEALAQEAIREVPNVIERAAHKGQRSACVYSTNWYVGHETREGWWDYRDVYHLPDHALAVEDHCKRLGLRCDWRCSPGSSGGQTGSGNPGARPSASLIVHW